jgi:hypothetical protein
MPENDAFESRLRAHLARAAERDADPTAAHRIVAGAREALHRGGARGTRLMPLVAGVAAAALLAAALSTAAFLHGRGQSSVAPPVSSPTALPIVAPGPTQLPSPSIGAPVAVPTAATTPNLALDGLAGPLSVGGTVQAMASGPGLPVVAYRSTSGSCQDGSFTTYVWDGAHWYRTTQTGGPRLITAGMGWDPPTGHLLMVGYACDTSSSPSPSPAPSSSPTSPSSAATPSATPASSPTPSPSASSSPQASQTPYPPSPPSETWQWQPTADKLGGRWQMLNPVHRPSQDQATLSLAYDPASHRTLLLQYYGFRDLGYATVWTWDGRDWTRAWHSCFYGCPDNYTPWAGMVQSPSGGVVIFDPDGLRRWTGSGWEKTGIAGLPDPDRNDMHAAPMFDAAAGRDLILAAGKLYAFDGARYTTSPLPPELQNRYRPFFVAASRNGQEAILWGGQAGSDSTLPHLSDTWVYAAGHWRQALAS